jgi:nucleoid-associated protein YgaU
LALSCASAPAAEPEPEPQPQPQPQLPPPPEEAPEEFIQDHANVAFEEVYDLNQDLLILEGAQNYVVGRNDTPSKIALRFYGRDNGYFFPLIILASRDVILDPDLIEVGMNLVVPDLQKNLDNQESRERIKSFLLDIAAVYEKKTNRWASTTRRELIKLAETL